MVVKWVQLHTCTANLWSRSSITQTYVHPIDASHSNCEVTMCGKCTAQQSYMCKISEFSEESCRQRMNVVHIIFLPGG